MATARADSLVVFSVDEQRLALPLAVVEKVVRTAEVSPLPGAPACVLGVISIQGEVTPIYDLRARMGRSVRPMLSTDHFVIARTWRRLVGLLVDVALDVVPAPAGLRVSEGGLLPGWQGIDSIVELEDHLILVQDLERFLSEEEEEALAAALAR